MSDDVKKIAGAESPAMTPLDQAELTEAQAQAFLNSLWPCGSMSHLSNYTRTYFEALLGDVPATLQGYQQEELRHRFAALLRSIATHLEASREAKF